MAIDLHPTATAVAALLRALPDEALERPTPCPEYTVAHLVDHIHSFAVGFTAAATKDPEILATGNRGGPPDVRRLGDDWRERIPARLDELADAWALPSSWEGMTTVGGLDVPGEVAGLIALDELVVHGWDLAVATGEPFEADAEVLGPLHTFVEGFVGDGPPRAGLFGPQVPVPDDAPLLDRVLGLTGRDPGWSP